MRAEEYLRQIRKIDAMIVNKQRDHKRWVEIAEGLGGGFSVGDRVQTTRDLHKGENAIVEYISIEEEIKALESKRNGIIETIERLPYNEYKILYEIYVEGYMLKEIPYHFDRSYAWVKKKKQEAMRLLQMMLDKKEG